MLMRLTRIKAGESDRTLVIRADQVIRLEDAGSHRVVELNQLGLVFEVREPLDGITEQWRAGLEQAAFTGARS